MTRHATARSSREISDIITTTSRTRGGFGDVISGTIENSSRRSRRRRSLGFQRPLLLRTINLAEVVDTSVRAGGFARFHEVRDRDRREEADDGHNDHDFNQREARLTGGIDLHICSVLSIAV